MKVFVVVFEEPDSYDVGTHTAPLELFADRHTAECVIDGLPGKPKNLYNSPSGVWGPRDELAIEEWELR